jgi:hypothetical protein
VAETGASGQEQPRLAAIVEYDPQAAAAAALQRQGEAGVDMPGLGDGLGESDHQKRK